jgi:hypothetical protein
MPEGWLENEHQEIPDPESEKPSDWDEEMDGDWEAGKIPITNFFYRNPFQNIFNFLRP